jgi:glycosyltransferase involved in cell wall biosynthesis
MNLLMATHVLPYPVDMACKGRMYQMLRHLSSYFEVTLVSLAQSKDTLETASALRPYARRFHPVSAPNKASPLHKAYYRVKTQVNSYARGIPADYFYANVPPMEKTLQRVLAAEGPFAALLVEYWYTSEMLSRTGGIFKIVDTHDVDFMKNQEMSAHAGASPLKRVAARLKHRNNASAEMSVLDRYDLVIALTEADREVFARHLGPHKDIRVVPTGVDTEYFSPSGRGKVRHRITFYGAMQVRGNIQAALYFYREILPGLARRFPESTYLILGGNPAREIRDLASDPRVMVSGFVTDVRPYLEESSVLICPFQMGYGFRGRVLEAMSLEVPVVSTSPAVRAMGLADGQGILLKDSAQDFGEAVAHVLADPAFAAELGKKGREVVKKRFSLEATYGAFCKDLYQRLSSPHR